MYMHTLPCGRAAVKNLPQGLVKAKLVTHSFAALQPSAPPARGDASMWLRSDQQEDGGCSGHGRAADFCPSLTFLTTYLFIRSLQRLRVSVKLQNNKCPLVRRKPYKTTPAA